MNCDETRGEFLDRDLTVPDVEAALRIAAHFNECQACRQVAGEYDELRKLLKHSDDEADSIEATALPDLQLPQAAPPGRREFKLPVSVLIQTALAVLALLGWGLYWRHRVEHRPAPQLASNEGPVAPQESGARPQASIVPANLPWTRADVDRRAALFSKVSESFEGRAAWVAVGDRASDVGLLDGPAAPPPKVLLVRLLMSQDDRSPSKTDLVIVPGQEVRVEVPFRPGEVLGYRIKTTAGPQPQLTLAAEVRTLDHGETLAALATQLQPQPGETLSAGRLQSRSGPYHLDVSFSETSL